MWTMWTIVEGVLNRCACESVRTHVPAGGRFLVFNTPYETLYAVTPVQSDSNSRGVRVERLCAMQWTLGPTPLSLNGDSLLESKAVSITADDGVLEARTGKAAVAISREPATVEIFDTGDVLALLRVGQRNSSGGAASAVPLHRRWE